MTPARRLVFCFLHSLTNQMFAEVLRGIERVTDAHGCQTMLAHYGYHAEREEMRLMSLLSYNIDGLILSERSHTERTRKMIEVRVFRSSKLWTASRLVSIWRWALTTLKLPIR